MTAAIGTRPPAHGLRILRVEVAEGLRAIVREPTALFFSVLFPVGFYALFTTIFGGQQGFVAGLPYAATNLATFGAFGVVSVMLMNPGTAVAEDRTRGWLRVKKVSAVPIGTTIAAKVIAALPYAVAVMLAFSAVSLLVAGPVLEFGSWTRLMVALLVGSLPFALLSLAVGFVLSAGASAAVLNAVLLPMAVASGLWFPLEMMPPFVQNLAPLLPTYHLSRLALAQLTGADAGVHVVALLISTAVAAALSGWAYRNLRV
ncbi:MAG: ABC transporter permease [Pseudonocardia sp.]|nr:ABC transporter permease [Pseudonocardia sp.]